MGSKIQPSIFTPPRLGPGAIYLRSLDGFFRANADLIKVAEVEPQILWTKPTSGGGSAKGNPVERRFLASLPQRLLTHGVGYPVGGTICDQVNHIPEFRLWNSELAVPWTSEHLSILHVEAARGVEPCGFLMPPLQTDAGVKLAAQNIKNRAAALHLPFAFETGVNYFAPRHDEMRDGEFFAAIAEEANCGILLDLTNLWINEKNGRAKITDIVAQLPLERVWEVHLAGIELELGYWVDAHSRGIDPDLVVIASEVMASLPNLGAIIFELAPDRVSTFETRAFLKEMETLHRLWEKAPAARPAERGSQSCSAFVGANAQPQLTPDHWERVIAQRMLSACERPTGAGERIEIRSVDEERFSLYTHLAASFRSGAIAELLGNTVRLLLLGLGEQGLHNLVQDYIARTPVVGFPTDEALQFYRFLRGNPLPVPGLDEMLRFEATLVEAAANNTAMQVELTKDIDVMLADVAAGRLPGPSSDRPATLFEIGVDPVPFIRICQEA